MTTKETNTTNKRRARKTAGRERTIIIITTTQSTQISVSTIITTKIETTEKISPNIRRTTRNITRITKQRTITITTDKSCEHQQRQPKQDQQQ